MVVHHLRAAADRAVAGGFDRRVGVAHAEVAAQRPVGQVQVEVQLQVAAGVLLLDPEVVGAGVAVGDVAQGEVATGHAGVAVAVDVEQIHQLAQVGDHPRRRRTGAQALAEGVEPGRHIGQGHACRQCRHHRLRGAAALVGAHVVLLPGQAAAQGEVLVGQESQVQLGVVELVVGALRTDADLRAGAVDRRTADPAPRVDVARVEPVVDVGQVAVVAEVPAVALGVLDVERHRGLAWIAELGLRAADQRFHAQAVVEAVLEQGAELAELGGQFVEARLGAHVDVVEHAVDQVAALVHLGGADDRLRLAALGGVAAEGDGLQEVFLAGGVELGVQAVHAQGGGVAELELQRAGHAGAFLVVAQAAVARQPRMERVARGLVGGDVFGRVGGARDQHPAGVVAVGCGRAAATVVGRLLRGVAARAAEGGGAARRGVARRPAHAAEALLVDGALAVGHRQQGADPAIGPGVGDQRRSARVHVPGQVVVAALRADRGGEAVVVERARRAQVHRRAQRTLVHLRRLGLAHGDVAEQLGGEHVEVETAAAVGAAGAVGGAGGGQRLEPVDAHAGEVRAQATHRDRAAFAGVAVDRDAGNALQRLGQVQVGKLADVLGHDRVDLLGAEALLVQRLFQAGAEGADDFDPVQVGRGGMWHGVGLGLLGVGRQRAGEGKRDRGGEHGNRCLTAVGVMLHWVPPQGCVLRGCWKWRRIVSRTRSWAGVDDTDGQKRP